MNEPRIAKNVNTHKQQMQTHCCCCCCRLLRSVRFAIIWQRCEFIRLFQLIVSRAFELLPFYFFLPFKFAMFVFDLHLYFRENVEHQFGKSCGYMHSQKWKVSNRFISIRNRQEMKLLWVRHNSWLHTHKCYLSMRTFEWKMKFGCSFESRRIARFCMWNCK